MMIFFLGLAVTGSAYVLLWLFKMPNKVNPFVPFEKPIDKEDCKKKWLKILKQCPKTGVNYLVVGGGFLGSRIIECLLQRNEKVAVFDFDTMSKWATDSRVISTQTMLHSV
jgi:hypothetical protein